MGKEDLRDLEAKSGQRRSWRGPRNSEQQRAVEEEPGSWREAEGELAMAICRKKKMQKKKKQKKKKKKKKKKEEEQAKQGEAGEMAMNDELCALFFFFFFSVFLPCSSSSSSSPLFCFLLLLPCSVFSPVPLFSLCFSIATRRCSGPGVAGGPVIPPSLWTGQQRETWFLPSNVNRSSIL
jgi:cation transport ATPase